MTTKMRTTRKTDVLSKVELSSMKMRKKFISTPYQMKCFGKDLVVVRPNSHMVRTGYKWSEL